MKWLKQFKRLPYFFQWLYEKVTTSIAFYPMMMALGFFLFTGLMFFLESKGLTQRLGENFPTFLLIKSWNVAQSILTVLIGALISLMVFSFSMVMVLLNNASSNFSPRILPSLIANKFHQVVLGTYLGTITYCILLALNMTPEQPKIPLPSISVLIAIVLGLLCLILFVFFIHSISESVQVGKILELLYNTTLHNLKDGMVSQLKNTPLPSDLKNGFRYVADRSGNLKNVNIKSLAKICEQENIQIKVLISESRFMLEGADLFLTNKKIDEDLKNKILENFILSTSETASDDHIIGFKQITEIALKAMSPGINDPGTAISAINYLTILFAEKIKLTENGAVEITDKNEDALPIRLWLTIISFEELLAFVLAPLRQYARHDLLVMLKILEMLKFLYSRSHCQSHHLESIKNEVHILEDDTSDYLTNSADYGKVSLFINTHFTKKNTL